jgi:hypothetical protein
MREVPEYATEMELAKIAWLTPSFPHLRGHVFFAVRETINDILKASDLQKTIICNGKRKYFSHLFETYRDCLDNIWVLERGVRAWNVKTLLKAISVRHNAYCKVCETFGGGYIVDISEVLSDGLICGHCYNRSLRYAKKIFGYDDIDALKLSVGMTQLVVKKLENASSKRGEIIGHGHECPRMPPRFVQWDLDAETKAEDRHERKAKKKNRRARSGAEMLDVMIARKTAIKDAKDLYRRAGIAHTYNCYMERAFELTMLRLHYCGVTSASDVVEQVRDYWFSKDARFASRVKNCVPLVFQGIERTGIIKKSRKSRRYFFDLRGANGLSSRDDVQFVEGYLEWFDCAWQHLDSPLYADGRLHVWQRKFRGLCDSLSETSYLWKD